MYTYTAKDRDCLKRAMYFESQRSDASGFMAVGSVIMNRLTSGMYAQTICGVVTQKNQFAPGLMARKVDESTAPDLDKAAEAVLKGARHPDVKEAMFFHRKGLRFGYDNMHYVAVAGGNEFYEKRGQDGQLQTAEPKPVDQYVLAYAADGMQQQAIDSVMMGSAAPQQSLTAAPVIAANLPAASGPILSNPPPSTSTIAPVITAAVSRAGMPSDFVTAYAVPQNSQLPEARPYQASLTATVPIPLARPGEPTISTQKRPGAGIAMASQPNRSGMSYQDWNMRTGNW
ncbi:cell wall hydrolase [Neorhizobium lilium]|uniref:cell wall hydrolase n=1 Tax=Neorhizobium lilium TaxID=2503024 RepID=UPI003CCABF03